MSKCYVWLYQLFPVDAIVVGIYCFVDISTDGVAHDHNKL